MVVSNNNWHASSPMLDVLRDMYACMHCDRYIINIGNHLNYSNSELKQYIICIQ